MIVKFKKLHPEAVIPTFSKPGDAGADMVAISVRWDAQYDYWEYDTGIALELSEGYAGLLIPRSSNSNKDLFLSNGIGLLDSGFRGSIRWRFKESELRGVRFKRHYNVGDRVGQIMIVPVLPITFVEVDKLTDSIRGEGGYGHTGS